MSFEFLKMILFCSGLYIATTTFASVYGSGFYTVESNPFQRPYSGWAVEFWQSLMTAPQGFDKIVDPTTGQQKCWLHESLNYPVVMLAHIEGRSDYNPYCDMSPQKAILVTLLAGECDSALLINVTDHEKLATCARESDEGLKEWEISIDGAIAAKGFGDNSISRQFKVNGTPPFDVVIPKNNNWQIDIDALAFQKFKVNDTAIKVPAAAHGYYVILKPLPPGEHKVLVYYVRTFPGDANNTPVITKSVATVTVK